MWLCAIVALQYPHMRTGMEQSWRQRLVEATEKSGKSLRALSLEVGKSHGYLFSVIHDGKEPGVDALVKLADACGVSESWLLFGVSMDPDTEKLLQLYAELSSDQKRTFFSLAEAAARLAKPSEETKS